MGKWEEPITRKKSLRGRKNFVFRNHSNPTGYISKSKKTIKYWDYGRYLQLVADFVKFVGKRIL